MIKKEGKVPHITSCSNCGKGFEACSEEEACAPDRLCFNCYQSVKFKVKVDTYFSMMREAIEKAVSSDNYSEIEESMNFAYSNLMRLLEGMSGQEFDKDYNY